jgi:demethylmenaquinone methyltransferase/2-methoxy-6-polyprenyl-1,4-benzoquinol methylase
MFGRVAPRYDFLNHLLSLNFDRYWRALTVRRLRSVLERPGARVMDICCGTGDLLLAVKRASGGTVTGSDFCHPMLVAAKRKIAESGLDAAVVEADALALPVPDNSLDLVTSAFGFRNLANYENGLNEIRRALKPGGTAAILEFSTPPNAAFGALYRFYSRRILPLVGGALSGDPGAYTYLPESVRKFPDAEGLAAMMGEAGFADVRFERMSAGIVALHIGQA